MLYGSDASRAQTGITTPAFGSLAAVRAALFDHDKTTADCAIVGLYRAMQADGDQTLEPFLADLKSPSVAKRAQTIAEVERALPALWGYRQGLPSVSGPKAVELLASGFWNRRRPDRRPIRHRNDQAVFESERARQGRLLQALQTALRDSEPAFRHQAASVIEKAGRETDQQLYDGSLEMGEGPNTPAILSALAAAADAMQTSDAALSGRLRTLREKVGTPHPRA